MPLLLAVVGAAMCGLVLAPVLRGIGPYSPGIDTGARSYVLIQGYPWAPRTLKGTLDDFECICVEGAHTRAPAYLVVIQGVGPGRRRFIANVEDKRPATEAIGNELAEYLGLPFSAKCPE